MRKLFKGGNYSRAETIRRNTVFTSDLESNSFYTELLLLLQLDSFPNLFSSKTQIEDAVISNRLKIHGEEGLSDKSLSCGSMVLHQS